MTYAEYLRAQGATEEDIKALDTPIGRKAFDKMQSDLATSAAEAERQRQNAIAYQEKANDWYQQESGNLVKFKNEAVANAAEAARLKTALLELQKKGLVNIAEELGFKVDEPNPNPNPNPNNPAGFQPENYYTRQDILTMVEKEGLAIATAQDIAAEHAILFPGKRLNFRDLREKAMQQRKPLEQVWMEEYKVSDARTARETAERDAERKKWMDEGAKTREAELVSKFGNPETRPLEPSVSPFAPRNAADPRAGKQPWEVGTDDQLSNIRTQRGTQAVMKSLVTKPN